MSASFNEAAMTATTPCAHGQHGNLACGACWGLLIRTSRRPRATAARACPGCKVG